MEPALVDALAARCTVLGFTVARDDGAHLSLHREFLRARWPFGRRRITYDATVTLDDRERTVRLRERTIEVSSGVFLTAEHETSTQIGRTVRRRRAGRSIGIDGSSVAFDLDLGAVSRAVQSITEAHGWHFSSVVVAT